MTRIPGIQRQLYPPEWHDIANLIKGAADWRCEACGVPHGKSPNVLTVHHIDFNPQKNDRANLIALCQRCHLKIQGMMVQPRNRYEVIMKLRNPGQQHYLRM